MRPGRPGDRAVEQAAILAVILALHLAEEPLGKKAAHVEGHGPKLRAVIAQEAAPEGRADDADVEFAPADGLEIGPSAPSGGG